MTSNSIPTTGREYADKANTPVPYPAYRCKATATESPRLGRTHLCKITVDHGGEHVCLCGKAWPQATAGRATA